MMQYPVNAIPVYEFAVSITPERLVQGHFYFTSFLKPFKILTDVLVGVTD